MSKVLSQQELEVYLWGAATTLRGLIDASDYKQYVFPLLFFKRLSDIWDDDYKSALIDTNDDGRANLTDPLFLMRHVFLGTTPPPPPTIANPGEDPTPDDLPCAHDA